MFPATGAVAAEDGSTLYAIAPPGTTTASAATSRRRLFWDMGILSFCHLGGKVAESRCTCRGSDNKNFPESAETALYSSPKAVPRYGPITSRRTFSQLVGTPPR
ncbi:hypothetical protein GCM10025331_84990 [Actinoplanes utahensis]|nr:hypothetical protein Aut01nite_33910 [Actinoplanes utahensis]